MKTKHPDSVTIVDVASRAGVSVGTVSRMLNQKPNISPESVARVEDAIASLGYRKCQSAGQLVSRRIGYNVRAGNIGVVFSDLSPAWARHPLTLAHTLGIEQACRERGFHAIIELSAEGKGMPRCIAEGKSDGILIKAIRAMPAFVKEMTGRLPIVALSNLEQNPEIHQVAADDRGAGWRVASYLWQRGHRRIAFVCSQSDHPMFFARLQGYEGFLRQHRAYRPDLVVLKDSQLITPDPEETPPDMGASVEHLFSRASADRPTALVAANDWMAFGLYLALRSKGLRIPDDVSIVGFDNWATICTTVSPALTSYDMSFSSVSYQATIALLDRIVEPAKNHEPATQLVQGQLIERLSVRQIPPS